MVNAYCFFFFRFFFLSSRPIGVSDTHQKLENTTHTLYIRLYSGVRCGDSSDNEGYGKQQSMHASLYHLVRLSLYPAHFGIATNCIVNLKNRIPN